MDGFEFHRDRTDEDSAKRLALVRAGYLVWSLTWHDLEAVLGKGDDALDVLGDDHGRMAKLQRTLDALWDTGSIRSRLAEPSLMLLVRYLRNPDTRAWKRAVFTHLLGSFQPTDMQSAVLKREFADAVAGEVPSMVQDAIGELPEETAFAGRGKWRSTPPDFAQIFLALPLTAVEPPDPDELIVALHLDDAARSADQDYRREWNGVLRLYNLLQFLPNGWWTAVPGIDVAAARWVNACVTEIAAVPGAGWRIARLALPVPHNCSLDFMKPLRYRGHHGDSKSGRTPPAGQSFPTSQRARRSRVARYQKPRAGGRSRL